MLFLLQPSMRSMALLRKVVESAGGKTGGTAVDDTYATTIYLLVYGQQPRLLSEVSPQVEMLTNCERLAAMNVARLAAETAHCRMSYLEFKQRNNPTDVDALQPSSLCYVYREKSQVSPLAQTKLVNFQAFICTWEEEAAQNFSRSGADSTRHMRLT